MHIADGILSNSPEGVAALVAGVVVAAAGTAVGLHRMDYERVPQVAILSSAFFIVSLIHVPVPGTSVHLVLNGLVGLILGWAAFPAVLVALVLQMVFFGYGGLTTLGINTMAMAMPAVACHYLFRSAISSVRETVVFAAGFAAGAFAFAFAAVLHAAAYLAAGREFQGLAAGVLTAHLVVAVVEGLVTGSVVAFVRKVRPELLQAPLVAVGNCRV